LPKDVEVEVDEKFKKIEFVRLSQKNVIYIDNHRVRTYLCIHCGVIVHSKIDHTRWHQNMVDMIAKATNDVDLSQLTYQPVEVNKIVKERQGIISLY